jgi:tetraacyldisaccharide 4'-kinase
VLPLAIALEQGRFHGAIARACAAAWACVAERTVVRHLDFPIRTRIVAVGGATLGGSGKTPLAIACAAELASRGARVALVGHAYRARPRRARVVAVDDALHEIGDEALMAARALAPAGVRVVVAPGRGEAIAFAARDADILVLDGVAQTAPVRASLALLAVDAMVPWGGACAVAPRGDLRAPKDALLRACDGVVAIGDASNLVAIGHAPDDSPESSPLVERWLGRIASSGARVGDAILTWDDLARRRVGLLCALARPERVVRFLEGRGIVLRAIVRACNHGPVPATVLARAKDARIGLRIDTWLATRKCALHFAVAVARPGDVGNFLHAPIAAIEHELVLSSALRERLQALAAP